MKSDRPKVLFEICGKPMVSYVCGAARRAGAARIVVVVGYGEEQVREALADEGVEFARQDEQLGTGHAAAAARSCLRDFGGTVLVLNGDAPFITPRTLKRLVRQHRRTNAACTLLTCSTDEQGGKGRIIRNERGEIVRIVEEADASADERGIRETNSGCYCFEAPVLFKALKEIKPDNRKGEYYITDTVHVIHERGGKISSVMVNDATETLAPNSQAQLTEANRVMRTMILERLMRRGVCVVDADTTFIEADVQVGRNTVIYPFTYLRRGAKVGRNCRIGPFAFVDEGEKVPDDSVVEHNIARKD